MTGVAGLRGKDGKFTLSQKRLKTFDIVCGVIQGDMTNKFNIGNYNKEIESPSNRKMF